MSLETSMPRVIGRDLGMEAELLAVLPPALSDVVTVEVVNSDTGLTRVIVRVKVVETERENGGAGDVDPV